MGGSTVRGKVGTREKIVRAAAGLLAEGGREAVSVRSVGGAAGVQAPTIYRQFGDMRGLLDAVASHGFSEYLGSKVAQEAIGDPVEELRRGWDLHVGFGLANPDLYALMYGNPRPGKTPAAASEAHRLLRGLVQRVAEGGRLRVGVETAVGLIHAANVGFVLTQAARRPEDRDPVLFRAAREAILSAVITDAPPESTAGHDRIVYRSVALKAILSETGGKLTPAEGALLSEWLDRLAENPG